MKLKETVTYKSSIIKSSTYDWETQTLEVCFSNNSVYRYEDIPVYEYTRFKDGDSQGKALNKFIKSLKTKTKKIEEANVEN